MKKIKTTVNMPRAKKAVAVSPYQTADIAYIEAKTVRELATCTCINTLTRLLDIAYDAVADQLRKQREKDAA